MWDKIIEYGKQILALASTQQKHGEQIKELQENIKEIREDVRGLRYEVSELSRLVEHVILELQRDREIAQRDRENLLLRLEVALLKSGKELPSGRDLDTSDN